METAQTEEEASKIVRRLKIPKGMEGEIKQLSLQIDSSKNSEIQILGDLITQLRKFFPNALPLEILTEKGISHGLSKEFIEKIITHLNNLGLVLINRDSTNNKSHTILKFPNLPVVHDKLHIS